MTEKKEEKKEEKYISAVETRSMCIENIPKKNIANNEVKNKEEKNIVNNELKNKEEKNIVNNEVKNKEEKNIANNEVKNKEETNIANNEVKNKEEKKLKSLIEDLEEKFEERKSDDFGTSYDSFIDQQMKVNYILNCKKIENICPEAKSFIKLKDNNFLLYNKCEIFIYDSFLDNLLAHEDFKSTISCISESKSDDKDILIIVSLKEENPFKLELRKHKDTIIVVRKKLKINKFSANIFLEIEKNKYLISNKEGTFFCDDGLGVIKYEILLEEEFKIGEIIKVKNKRYVILIKNTNGKGTLYYFDLNRKDQKLKTLSPREDVSFIISKNCMAIMNLEYDESTKIFICACENKILLSKLNFNDNTFLIRICYSYYYELKNCDINCLFIIKNINENYIFKETNIPDSHFLIANIINKDKKSQFRIYDMKHIDECSYDHDSDIIQKGFIKAKINGEAFKNKVNCINQTKTGTFVICSFSEKNNHYSSLAIKSDGDNNDSTK